MYNQFEKGGNRTKKINEDFGRGEGRGGWAGGRVVVWVVFCRLHTLIHIHTPAGAHTHTHTHAHKAFKVGLVSEAWEPHGTAPPQLAQ